MENKIFYKKGYKYQLYGQYKVIVDIALPISYLAENNFLRLEYIKPGKGLLTIDSGYAWDGASGPTKDDSTNMRPSLIHDALYQLMRERLLDVSYRKQVDIYFRKCCKEDKMGWVRRTVYYYFVRNFGSIDYDKKKVLTAP